MKRILIDLDILTNALWKGELKQVAIEFEERVKAGEFELDYLVTFNKKHLRNKKEQILEFLKGRNMNPVEVVLPNEI